MKYSASYWIDDYLRTALYFRHAWPLSPTNRNFLFIKAGTESIYEKRDNGGAYSNKSNPEDSSPGEIFYAQVLPIKGLFFMPGLGFGVERKFKSGHLLSLDIQGNIGTGNIFRSSVRYWRSAWAPQPKGEPATPPDEVYEIRSRGTGITMRLSYLFNLYPIKSFYNPDAERY
ncbi:MAG: hypothetical protein M3Q97_07535 [Bacteroidota bacterium]|nr:hypothetical protein [Bacteroidota bacterium]